MMPTPLISLIIPTCNRTDLLAACLEAIMPQIPPDGSVEVIVGDDGRDFQTRDFLVRCHPSIQWNPGPKRGPGANRNLAVSHARGKWLVFIDDDCIPRPGFVAAYLTAFRDTGPNSLIVFAGETFRENETQFPLMKEAPYYHGRDDLPPSCNFAIPRMLFLECNGFDERYRTSFEDIEFFGRIATRGIRVQFVPAAAVDHPSRDLPGPVKLACRWEPRVISSYDLGASTMDILWRLPRHILLVILSRFRGRRACGDTLRAAIVFAGEFIVSLWKLPGWVLTHRNAPRSAVWKEQQSLDKTPRNYGL